MESSGTSLVPDSAPPGRPPSAQSIVLARWAPYGVLGLLALATIGFFGPQHRVKITHIAVCFAPDCRSTVFRSSEICGGTARLSKEPFPDLLSLMIFGALCFLQIMALATRRRKVHLFAGIFTLVGAVVVVGVLGYHSIIGHLLNQTQSMWGELATLLAAAGLFGLGMTQLLVAVSFSRTAAPPNS